MAGRFFFLNELDHTRYERNTRAQEAAELTRKLQDKVIYFLSINLEFFIALCSSDNFGLWAHRQQFFRTPLGKALQLAPAEKEKFYHALQGDPKKPETILNALINADDALIRRLLNQSPKLAITLSIFFNEPIIEAWYRTKSTKAEPVDLPLNKIQHAIFVYLKHIEKKISVHLLPTQISHKVDIALLLQHKDKTEISKLSHDTILINLLSLHLLLNEGLAILRQCHKKVSVGQRANQLITLFSNENAVLVTQPDVGFDAFKKGLGHYANKIFSSNKDDIGQMMSEYIFQ